MTRQTRGLETGGSIAVCTASPASTDSTAAQPQQAAVQSSLPESPILPDEPSPYRQSPPQPETAQPAAPVQKPAKDTLPNWLIVLLIIIYFPVGLTLMWVKSKWSLPVKSALTAVFSCVFICLIVLHASRLSSLPVSNIGASPRATSVTTTTAATTATTTATAVTKEEAPLSATSQKQLGEQAIIGACQTGDYDDILNNPEKHLGEKVKFTGEVLQVKSNSASNYACCRIGVKKGEDGVWQNDVFVLFQRDKSYPLSKKDIVTIYGTCYGTTYPCIGDQTVKVPYVDAFEIEME